MVENVVECDDLVVIDSIAILAFSVGLKIDSPSQRGIHEDLLFIENNREAHTTPMIFPGRCCC